MVSVIAAAFILGVPALPAGAESPGDMLLAQQPGEEPETEGEEGADPEGTQEETGAGEGETEGAAEPGPPWTYQMARIGIVMLVLLALAMGLTYRRLIVARKRGEV
jgi:hypothetical protein